MGADYRKSPKGVLQYSSAGTVAVGATVYINVSGQNAVENRVSAPMPYACVIRNLFGKATAPPGVGETYTYTLFLNGIATLLTCQTAGAVLLQSSDLVNGIAIAAGDLVSIRIVTSGAAGVVRHQAGFEVDQM